MIAPGTQHLAGPAHDTRHGIGSVDGLAKVKLLSSVVLWVILQVG
jgi:hypothetical protein